MTKTSEFREISESSEFKDKAQSLNSLNFLFSLKFLSGMILIPMRVR